MQFPQQIVTQLIVSYDSGGTAIAIGPGPQLIVYDASGVEIIRIGDDSGDQIIRVIGPTYITEIKDGSVLVYSASVPDLAFTELQAGTVILQNASGDAASLEIDSASSPTDQPSLQNSWGHAAPPNGPLIYTKVPTGFVGVYGRIAGGTNVAGTLLFTFPAGFRPPRTLRFPVSNGGGLAGGDVQVATNGQVTIGRAGGSASIEFAFSFPVF